MGFDRQWRRELEVVPSASVPKPKRGAAVRSAFTIIDVLVSVAVVAVLIGLMMPSLSKVRETARRVACSSNVRQHGLGLAMYSDDYRGQMPPSRYVDPRGGSGNHSEPHKMSTVRVEGSPNDWDGLGWLYHLDYLRAPGVYYCPSHRGLNTYSAQAELWKLEDSEIVSNFHFRGFSSVTARATSHGARIALITDSLTTREDFSHQSGSNVLRTDLSVVWFDDPSGVLVASLPDSLADEAATVKVLDAWETLDLTVPGMSPNFVPGEASSLR